ncbi:MAG: magnesium chelatase ATPase subunit D, partial [Pseudomonadota bacterium]
MSAAPDRWKLAATAAAALAVNPELLGGLVLRARPGPARDAFLDVVHALVNRPVSRLPAGLDPAALTAGLDLGETLRTGREVRTKGLMARLSGTIALVPMAERMNGGTAALLAAGLDAGDAPALILLDESAEPDEAVPEALADRLAIALSLDGLAVGDVGRQPYGPDDMPRARARLEAGIDDGAALETLT